MQTPYFKLVEGYAKPNGYIGIGMHSWDKFQEIRLQDGEAARLLSNYAIPREHPLVRRFVMAMRDEAILKEEFSYYHPETVRFENRFLGLSNGGGLMVLVYTCQALLGYGDDPEVVPFADISYKAFESLLDIQSLDDTTQFKPHLKKAYNYPYIEENAYFPCQYHLETLAHTTSWRSPEKTARLVRAIRHHDSIIKEDNQLQVKIKKHYYGPLCAYCRPFKAFDTTRTDIALRKTITHLAMVGGRDIDVVRRSAEAVEEALQTDGILRVTFASPYKKAYFKRNMEFPGPYSEISLESHHKTDRAIWCELTFWAVQLLSLLDGTV